MCRLGLFPPQFPGDEAYKVMLHQSNGQNDGIGVGFEDKGKLHVVKTCKSVFEAKRDQLIKHMPHNGWTIFHARSATVGKTEDRNAHPFLTENFVAAHNGSFKEHSYVRGSIPKGSLKGDTDSEAGAYLLSMVGAEEFYKQFVLKEWVGVFAAIDKQGLLWIMKDTHALYMSDTDYGTVFTTEKVYSDSERFDDGLICIDPNGEILKEHCEKPTHSTSKHGNERPTNQQWPTTQQKIFTGSCADDKEYKEDFSSETLVKLAGFLDNGSHIKQEYRNGMYYIAVTYPSGQESKIAMKVPLYICEDGKITVNPDAETVEICKRDVPNPEKRMSDEELSANVERWTKMASMERDLFDSEGSD